MKLAKRVPTKDKDKKVTALVCPDCGGTNIGYWLAYVPSGSYVCHDCNYRGSFIIKREVRVDDEGGAEEVVEAPLPED